MAPRGAVRRFASGAISRIREDRTLAAVCGLTLLAALVRFPTLDVQSFWFDESVTVLWTLEPSLSETLTDLRYNDATPPLYPVLAWGWSQLFGTGEVGLRSLSALLGTATVPALYLAGEALLSRRAGVVAAALGAVSPVLVWYSQEARPYALVVFLATLTTLCLVRALDDPSRGRLGLWAGACGLLLWTHYVTAFMVFAEAVVLLLRGWRAGAGRRTAIAIGAVGAAGAAVLPLALLQRSEGGAAWISAFPLDSRLSEMLDRYAGRWPDPSSDLRLLPLLLVLAAAALLVARARGPELKGAGVALTLAALAIGTSLAVAAAVTRLDYFSFRYLMAVLPALLLVVAAGVGARAAGRIGIGTAVALCAVWLALDLAIPLDRSLQRDDWRSAVAEIGTVSPARAIVVEPAWAPEPVSYYGHPLIQAPPGRRFAVDEVVILSWLPAWGAPVPSAAPSPARGFRRVEQRMVQNLRLVRFRARRAQRMSGEVLASRLEVIPGAVYLDGGLRTAPADPGATGAAVRRGRGRDPQLTPTGARERTLTGTRFPARRAAHGSAPDRGQVPRR